jgi:hypothetical protein
MPPAVRGPLCQEPDLESDTAEPGSADVQATLNGLVWGGKSPSARTKSTFALLQRSRLT